MRTPLLGLAILALAALPLASAAIGDVDVEASVDTDVALPATGATEAAPAPAPELPSVEHDLETPSVPAPDLIEVSSIRTGASTSASGIGVTAGAEAGAGDGAKPGREVLDKVLPMVEDAAPAAVATVGLAAMLQAMGAWRFLGLGAFALYSRLTKSDLLDNTHRDRVYKLIQETPGLGVSEISARTGLGWGTTVYHLDRLERHGFVANERGGLHKCYYPVGTLAREIRKGIGALKADTTRAIAEYLVAKPGATQTDLCKDLSLSPSQASKQVTKLEEAGLVRRQRDWKTVHLYPAEQLAPLLAGETTMPAPAPAPGIVAPLAA